MTSAAAVDRSGEMNDWSEDPADRALLSRSSSESGGFDSLVRTLSPTLARTLSNMSGGPSETYQCYICGFEDLPMDEDSYKLTNCACTVHAPCWKRYLQFTINNTQGRQPVCNRPAANAAWDPEANEHVGGKCNTPFADEDIKALLAPDTDGLFDHFVRLRSQNENPNLRICGRCGESVAGQPGMLKMTCSNASCGHIFCFEHGEACQVQRDGMTPDWSFEQRCEAFDGDKDNLDYLSKEIEAGNIRLCPHCNAPVSKNSGCNAMTCTSCDKGFCWLCGEKIIDSHGLPPHFSTFNRTSPCAGKQFVTADGEASQGPELTSGEASCSCCVFCGLFCVALPFMIAFGIVFCVLVVVIGCLFGILSPICRTFRGPIAEGETDPLLTALVTVLMASLGFIFFVPPLILMSPCWLPWFLYMRCRHQAWAREQEALAEGSVSQEESAEMVRAAELVAEHLREQEGETLLPPSSSS